jgi:hypothetical protein
MRTLACLFVVTAVFVIAGCEKKEPAPGKISGKVELDSKAMATGEVMFELAGKPPVTVAVKDGAYATELPPGIYTVRVSCRREIVNPKRKAPPGPGEPEPFEELVAPKFNSESTLTATVVTGQESTSNFSVSSK